MPEDKALFAFTNACDRTASHLMVRFLSYGAALQRSFMIK